VLAAGALVGSGLGPRAGAEDVTRRHTYRCWYPINPEAG